MKTRNIILAATFIAATIGLTAFKTVHSDRSNAPLKNTQAASNLDETADDSEAPYPCSEQRCKDSFGYIIVEPGNDGKTYLKITNETGKGIVYMPTSTLTAKRFQCMDMFQNGQIPKRWPPISSGVIIDSV